MKRKDNSESRLSSLRQFLSIAGCFLLSIVVLKLVEFFICDIDIPKRGQLLVNALVYNCVVASWIIIGTGIVYWLTSLLSKKVANVLAASFFALVLVSEVGLTIYAKHNGFALGSELFARPLSESMTAIRGAMGVVIPILLTLAIVGGFIALALWRAKSGKRKAGKITVLAVTLVFALLSLIFKMPNLLTFGINNYFVYNKCYYLVDDSIYYYRNWANSSQEDGSLNIEKLRLTDEELAEIIATHPEWGTPLDPEYPLERAFVADTFLNRFFSATAEGGHLPNIVIILVESMGREYMGWGAMPFVDSLAATGLYWPNCLSTSRRSYGAIPAVTGSVGGPKSFQFGTMPDHNTLFSLLKSEGYNTRAYYGGDFTFDCIYEYLTAQRIDYMSPFLKAYKDSPEGNNGFWWGATDDFLFRHTIEDLNENIGANQPHVSLITTLSMHEELRLDDKKRQNSYMQRVAKLNSQCDAKHKNLEGVSSAMFTDDYIREFIHQFSKRADFGNTIFVITGDHSSGRQNDDMLSYHHVPLIIWSPLINQPMRFNHLVTHNDVTPALYSLLTSKYGLHPQPTVHWLGDGLGPTPKTLVIVNYMHVITDIIFHNVYYHYDTRFPPEEIYTFDEGMKLKPCENKVMGDSSRRQFELLTKLYLYTYYANRLTNRPVFRSDFDPIKSIQLNSDLVCPYPNRPPSEVGTKHFDIIRPTPLKKIEGYSTIRVNIEADVKVNKDIDLTKYPDIGFSFDGEAKLTEYDKLSKFFDSNKDVSTETNHISLSKDYPMHDKTGTISIELVTPMWDDDYVEGTELTLSNVKINILYGK